LQVCSSESRVSIKKSRKIPEGFVSELISEVQSEIQFGSSRLQDFTKDYNKQIEKILLDWEFTPAGIVEQSVLDLFKAPLIMYALKLNAQAIIEIYGILERSAIIAIVNLFTSDTDKMWIVETLIQYSSLKKLAKILIKLKLWDKEDYKFARELYDLRNATAHKNLKKISEEVSSKEIVSLWNINNALSNHPVLQDLFIAIRLLFKLNNRYFSATDNGKKAQGLLESK
jgi:uncharacterized protein YutE (UPF0331/DUF86 family)